MCELEAKCGQVEKQKQVPNQLEELAGCVGGLEDDLCHLEGRLGPVLLPGGPAGTEMMPKEGAEEQVEIASMISASTTRLRLICNAIQSITKRLEL